MKTKALLMFIGLATASVIGAVGCQTPNPHLAKETSVMKTTAASPQESFVRLLNAIDARQWDTVRQQMADKVYTDYSNLFGAAPGVADADALVGQWRQLLTPLDATQHLLGAAEVFVEGDTATLRAPVRGYHLAHGAGGGEEWMVAGQYTASLELVDGAWRLTSLRLDTHYQTGNRGLLAQAGARARQLESSAEVSCELVRFTSLGDRMAGHLCLPAQRSGPVPGVVVLGSWTTVKEQMAGLYARKLAAQGYAALAFDPRGYGESAGMPRNVESPSGKIVDVKAAASFLAAHPAVAGDSVGAVGICAGAGYVAGAAGQSEAISAVALVAPWLHDAQMVRAIYGGEEGVGQRLEAAKEARARFEETGEVEYIPAASDTDASAAMYGPFDYYLSDQRGAVEAWPNAFAVMAWEDWLGFEPQPFAKDVNQPTLIVHSEEAALPQGARSFYDQLATEQKRAHWMKGTQFHFYDDEQTIGEVVEQLDAHFGAHLK